MQTKLLLLIFFLPLSIHAVDLNVCRIILNCILVLRQKFNLVQELSEKRILLGEHVEKSIQPPPSFPPIVRQVISQWLENIQFQIGLFHETNLNHLFRNNGLIEMVLKNPLAYTQRDLINSIFREDTTHVNPKCIGELLVPFIPSIKSAEERRLLIMDSLRKMQLPDFYLESTKWKNPAYRISSFLLQYFEYIFTLDYLEQQPPEKIPFPDRKNLCCLGDYFMDRFFKYTINIHLDGSPKNTRIALLAAECATMALICIPELDRNNKFLSTFKLFLAQISPVYFQTFNNIKEIL